MAQQNITIGAADAGNGDDYFTAFTKTESNFSELFDFKDTVPVQYISQESDFLVQDASTITLSENTAYFISADFTTAKNIICLNGSSWTSGSIDAATASFTGTGAMFQGTNVSFYIYNASVDPGITREAFSFTDNSAFTSKFLCETVQVENCLRWGTFTGMQIAEMDNSNSPNAQNGCVFVGTNNTLFSFNKFALTSTNAGFKGIDLGSSTAVILEFSNLFFVAPAGAFGISGLASSGNVPAGRLGMVGNSEFIGGMTDLENITVDDLRWQFTSNSPTADTQPDAMLSLTSNATATVIASANTPVLVAGTWVVERTSQFTGTTAGRYTYDAGKDLTVPADVVVDMEPSSGTNKDLTVYIALNGSIITNSGRKVRVDSGNPLNVTCLWQFKLSTSDFVEVYVENNTDTTNILVSGAINRGR
jgi:hypothetical protein